MTAYDAVSDPARGRITVSSAAVARAAALAVAECYGITGVATKRMRAGRVEMLNADECERGIVVVVEDERVTIELFVVVAYGYRVSEIAHNAINKIGSAIRQLLGDVAVHVNLNVQGLYL